MLDRASADASLANQIAADRLVAAPVRVVERELSLSLDDVRARPAVRRVVTMDDDVHFIPGGPVQAVPYREISTIYA